MKRCAVVLQELRFLPKHKSLVAAALETLAVRKADCVTEVIDEFAVVRTNVVKPKMLEKDVERLRSMVSAAAEIKERWGAEQIIGVDEAGRGCWAGPVCTAAFSLPTGTLLEGVKDSKLMSEKSRVQLLQEIVNCSAVTSVDLMHPDEIDKLNILQATRNSMNNSLKLVLPHVKSPMVFYDGRSILTPPFKQEKALKGASGTAFGIPALEVEKGDLRFQDIAGASIIAKSIRDAALLSIHETYPEYGFNEHKAYGTKKHQEALKTHGPIKGVHRRTFKPMTTMKTWRK